MSAPVCPASCVLENPSKVCLKCASVKRVKINATFVSIFTREDINHGKDEVKRECLATSVIQM